LLERLRGRQEWALVRALWRADCRLATAWWAVLVLRGVLPAAFAIAMGVLVGAVNGLATGLLAGLIAFLWKASPWLGAALGLAMVGNLVIAAVAGTLVPLFLRRMKIDPALASSVFVTTATDVAGFLLFLGLGAAFLARFQ